MGRRYWRISLRRVRLGQHQTGARDKKASDQQAGGFSAEHADKGHGRDLSAGVLVRLLPVYPQA